MEANYNTLYVLKKQKLINIILRKQTKIDLLTFSFSEICIFERQGGLVKRSFEFCKRNVKNCLFKFSLLKTMSSFFNTVLLNFSMIYHENRYFFKGVLYVYTF